MNRKSSSSSSSSSTQKKKLSQSHPQPQLPSKKNGRIPRNPSKNVNSKSSGAGGSSSNGAFYGSVSGEVPSGRVRFLLANSCTSSSSSSSSSSSGASLGRRPVKFVSKTPKSAPIVAQPLPSNKARVLREIKLKDNVSGKPTWQQPLGCKRTTPMPRLGQSGKRPTCKSTLNSNKTSALDEFSSGSRELEQEKRGANVRIQDKSAHLTPVSELGIRSGLGYGSNGKVAADGRPSNGSSSRDRTPPVQESVSPEIQCGSSMILSAATKTQTCYAAGHILSGISDKRKCRPKGILIVGENDLNVSKPKPLNNFDDVDGADCIVSTMPFPADASMQWLLSPCDEERDQEKDKFNDGLYQFRQVVGCQGLNTPSPLLDRSISSDICNISSGRSLSREHSGKGMGRGAGSLVSPKEPSQLRSFVYLSSDKAIDSPYDTTLTCEVDPSLHLKEVGDHQYDIEEKKSPSSIDTLGSENVIQTPESNSSPDKYRGLSWLQAERHDLGSDFDSTAVDLQSPTSHASSWDPNGSSFQFESLAISSDSLDLSQFPRVLSNRRSCNSDSISWREEMNSQIPETDEDGYVNGSSVKQDSKPQGIQNGEFDKKRGAEKSRELLHNAIPCSAADSISTDGGSLIHSEDSDWMSCYMNHFLGL